MATGSQHATEDGMPLLRIGELAAQTGTTLRTLHYYEELGLIQPAKRTKGGFRLYHPDTLRHVQFIQYLREMGLELPQIQTLMEARRTGDGRPAACLRNAVETELRRVKSLIHRYSRLREELDATLDILKECSDRECTKTPGSAACPECDVICHREYVPGTFAVHPCHPSKH